MKFHSIKESHIKFAGHCAGYAFKIKTDFVRSSVIFLYYNFVVTFVKLRKYSSNTLWVYFKKHILMLWFSQFDVLLYKWILNKNVILHLGPTIATKNTYNVAYRHVQCRMETKTIICVILHNSCGIYSRARLYRINALSFNILNRKCSYSFVWWNFYDEECLPESDKRFHWFFVLDIQERGAAVSYKICNRNFSGWNNIDNKDGWK